MTHTAQARVIPPGIEVVEAGVGIHFLAGVEGGEVLDESVNVRTKYRVVCFAEGQNFVFPYDCAVAVCDCLGAAEVVGSLFNYRCPRGLRRL